MWRDPVAHQWMRSTDISYKLNNIVPVEVEVFAVLFTAVPLVVLLAMQDFGLYGVT